MDGDGEKDRWVEVRGRVEMGMGMVDRWIGG